MHKGLDEEYACHCKHCRYRQTDYNSSRYRAAHLNAVACAVVPCGYDGKAVGKTRHEADYKGGDIACGAKRRYSVNADSPSNYNSINHAVKLLEKVSDNNGYRKGEYHLGGIARSKLFHMFYPFKIISIV